MNELASIRTSDATTTISPIDSSHPLITSMSELEQDQSKTTQDLFKTNNGPKNQKQEDSGDFSDKIFRPIVWFEHTRDEKRAHSHRVYINWDSRRQRKGRLPVIKPMSKEEQEALGLKPKDIVVQHSIFRLWGWNLTSVHWWLAFIMFSGSWAWIVNSAFMVWPLSNETANSYLVGVSGVLGGLLFLIGGYLSFYEAINVEEERQLGVTVKNKGDKVQVTSKGNEDSVWDEAKAAYEDHLIKRRSKIHFWDFRPRELGYWLTLFNFIGCVFYLVSMILGFPNVLPPDASDAVWDGAYWGTQLIGILLSFIAGLMAVVEVQGNFFGPRIRNIGWEAAFWNIWGCLGFVLAAISGYWDDNDNVFRYGVGVCAFWGSITFVFSTYFMMLEACNPNSGKLSCKLITFGCTECGEQAPLYEFYMDIDGDSEDELIYVIPPKSGDVNV